MKVFSRSTLSLCILSPVGATRRLYQIMETKERKKERKYIAPDVVCIECELESAILYGSEVGSQMDPGESEDGCIGDDL